MGLAQARPPDGRHPPRPSKTHRRCCCPHTLAKLHTGLHNVRRGVRNVGPLFLASAGALREIVEGQSGPGHRCAEEDLRVSQAVAAVDRHGDLGATGFRQGIAEHLYPG